MTKNTTKAFLNFIQKVGQNKEEEIELHLPSGTSGTFSVDILFAQIYI